MNGAKIYIEIILHDDQRKLRVAMKLPVDHEFALRISRLAIDIADQNDETYTIEIERNGEKKSCTYIGIVNDGDSEEITADMLPDELRVLLKNLGIDL